MKEIEVKIKREGYRFQRSIVCRKLFLSAWLLCCGLNLFTESLRGTEFSSFHSKSRDESLVNIFFSVKKKNLFICIATLLTQNMNINKCLYWLICEQRQILTFTGCFPCIYKEQTCCLNADRSFDNLYSRWPLKCVCGPQQSTPTDFLNCTTSTFAQQPRFQMKFKHAMKQPDLYGSTSVHICLGVSLVKAEFMLSCIMRTVFHFLTKHFKDCITKQQRKCSIFIHWCDVYRNVSHLSFIHTE